MTHSDVNDILLKGASCLDITPSMFKEATAHYKAVGAFLGNCGVDADITPFGSILTGTVVRPYSEDENAYFDIDVLVNRPNLDCMENTPREARGPVKDALLNSDRYREMTKSYDECLTIEYVANGVEGGFRLDLSTCVDDKANPKARACATYPNYSDATISMAWENPEQWHGSNPRGLCQWFIDKNERFAATGRNQRKANIFEKNQHIFASIEDVPDSLDRSAMQRAVQVLKRSRDMFYNRLCKPNEAPASCIISVIVGNLSDSLSDSATTTDFLNGFVQYASSIVRTESLPNPVFDEDLIQKWTYINFTDFTLWVKDIERNLADLHDGTNTKRNAAAESIFGREVGRKALPTAAIVSASNIIKPSKPWAM